MFLWWTLLIACSSSMDDCIIAFKYQFWFCCIYRWIHSTLLIFLHFLIQSWIQHMIALLEQKKFQPGILLGKEISVLWSLTRNFVSFNSFLFVSSFRINIKQSSKLTNKPMIILKPYFYSLDPSYCLMVITYPKILGSFGKNRNKLFFNILTIITSFRV